MHSVTCIGNKTFHKIQIRHLEFSYFMTPESVELLPFTLMLFFFFLKFSSWMSWLEAFRGQKLLLENPGCYVSLWEVALQLFIPLLFDIPAPWHSSGSVQVYLDGAAPLPGAASSPLSRCVSSPLVEGTYDQHVIQWDESCKDAQGPPATLPSVVQSGKSSCGCWGLHCSL